MLSVIITWRGGDGLREMAVKNTLACIEAQNEGGELIVVTDKYPHRPFNRAWLNNIGVKRATTDNLLFVDADVLFGCEYFKLIEEKAKTHKIFLGYKRLYAVKGRDNPDPRWVTVSMTSAMGGVWFCNKDVYWEIGGSNESYFGYGGEDNDLKERVVWYLKTDQIPCLNYTLIHQYHNWVDVETKEYKANCELLRKVRDNPGKYIKVLRKLELGKEECPTPCPILQ